MVETETPLEEARHIPPLAKPKPRAKRTRVTRAKIDTIWILATTTEGEVTEAAFLSEKQAKDMANLAHNLFNRRDCTVRPVKVWKQP